MSVTGFLHLRILVLLVLSVAVLAACEPRQKPDEHPDATGRAVVVAALVNA